jgi:integrase
MSLYRQKGSKVWWYEFQFAGQRIRESSKTASKKLAGEALQVRRRQLEEGYNGIKKPKPPKTFAKAAEEFIAVRRPISAANTMEIAERSVKQLLPFIGDKVLCDITPHDIQRIVSARQAKGASNRYINLTINTLRSILRRNHQWERLRPDYKSLKEPKLVGKALSKEEEKKLLKECRMSTSRVLYTAVILGLYAGMRLDEIRWLQWKEIDLQRGFLTVGKSKTSYGEHRIIPLVPQVLDLLKEWAEQFPNRLPAHFVLPAEGYSSRVGNVFRHDPNRPMGSWKRAWQTARRRSGIHLRFHDLRHTTVTRLLESGRSIPQIAPIMGWSASAMYEMSIRYSEWSLEAKRETMSALAAPNMAGARQAGDLAFTSAEGASSKSPQLA